MSYIQTLRRKAEATRKQKMAHLFNKMARWKKNPAEWSPAVLALAKLAKRQGRPYRRAVMSGFASELGNEAQKRYRNAFGLDLRHRKLMS